jgi:hypothetical protein
MSGRAVLWRKRHKGSGMMRRPYTALSAVLVIAIVALAYWGAGRVPYLGGLVDSAEADSFRTEQAVVINKLYKPIDVEFPFPSINGVGLSPIKEWLSSWTDGHIAGMSGRNEAAGCEVGRKCGHFRQFFPAPELYSDFAHERLGSPCIVETYVNVERCILSNWERIYPIKLYIDRRPFALDESATLNAADYRQNTSKNSDSGGPSNHGPIRGIGLIVLIVLGAWVGVWSIVFWDSLGLWRWLLSAIGWAVMIGSIVQGLPVHP